MRSPRALVAWSIVALAVVVAGSVCAAEDRGLPFEVGACARVSEAPEIDGMLDDACWADTLPLEPFQKLTLGTMAEQQSTGYMVYDAERIYIGVECREPHMDRVKATVTERDGPTYTDDCIEIFLVPPDSPILARFEERVRYFHLVVNTLGTRYDEIGMNSPDAFDAEWRAETSVLDNGWSLEIAVPFSAFGVGVEDGDVWRGNISRSRTVEAEYSTWAPLQRTFHDRANFGQIVFTRDVGATAQRIDQLEFAALRDGLLVPRLRDLRDQIERLQQRAARLPDNCRARGLRDAGRLAGRLRNLEFGLRRLTPENFRDTWQRFDGRLARVEADTADLRDEVAMLAATGGGVEPWEIFITEAMTNDRLPSNRWPQDVATRDRIEIVGCPGEYESATFSVYAVEAMEDVELTIADLQGRGRPLDASCIDPYLVKCWYQAGRGIGDIGRRLLVPELLLKDGDLVRVDHEEKHNYVRAEPGSDRYLDASLDDSSNLADLRPKDAQTLQPVDMPARTLQQFWLRAHIPADAAPGLYSGTVTVSAAGGQSAELPVRMRVLPFTLDDPMIEYSIYYRGKLDEDGEGSISSEWKTEEQFLAEQRDMVAHNVMNPTIYQRMDEELLPRVFELREQAGMDHPRVYSLGISTGAPKTDEALQNLKDGVAEWREFVEERGYETLYVYGIDEAKGEELEAERAAFEAVHDVDAKVYVACYKDWFELVGDLLDMPVWSGQPLAEEAEKAHSVGARIFNYGNPQGGVEEPETYRRNFGLLLWSVNYDGAMTYAYQHSFGHGWNDFDSDRYRDHNMAYPAVDGIIGTVQWEGYREASDDVAYLTTLLNLIDEAEAEGGPAAARAQNAREWIETLDPNDDLNEIRAEMIRRIMTLTKHK